jgi:hypothetical protein
MLATIKGYWALIPNWAQSLILILLLAGGDYIFDPNHELSWRGLGLALFAAAMNWYNTHVGHAVGRADAIVAIVQKTVPPAPVDTNTTQETS